MLHLQSIRINHDGDSLPGKNGESLLGPWPGQMAVVRYSLSPVPKHNLW